MRMPKSAFHSGPPWLPMAALSSLLCLLQVGAQAQLITINEWLANTQPPQVDFIELYNRGSTSVLLDGYHLTDDAAVPAKFPIPPGTVMAPGGYLVFDANQLNFTLSGNGGAIGLYGPGGSVIDYLTFGAQALGVSSGRWPDGTANIFALPTPTPHAANAAPPPSVFVNEWMADNATGLADEDGDREDWLELFNTNSWSMEVGGFYLTDTALDLRKWQFPAGATIPPQGFLLVFASSKDRRIWGAPLHTNFRLSGNGEAIGLCAPDGMTVVDWIDFGSQTTDVSQGRFPDGAAERADLTPTPGAANQKPSGITVKEFTFPFAIDGPDSVFFHLFDVVAPGLIAVEVSWNGASQNLALELRGRRQPSLPDPTAPYASAAGPSPLSLSYLATPADLDRGPGWRLVIRDPSGIGQAIGSVKLSIPFQTNSHLALLRERVSLRGGNLWPSPFLQGRFLAELAATPQDGLHGIITLKRPIDCKDSDELERLGVVRQTHFSGPGWPAYGLVRKGTDLNHPVIQAALSAFTPLEPEDKVDPHILLGNYQRFRIVPEDGSALNYAVRPDGALLLSVQFAKDVTVDRARTILAAEAMAFSPIADRLWRVEMAPARLLALAAYDEVEWIEAGPLPLLPLNDRTRQNLNVDPVQNATINAVAGTISYGGWSGLGVTIGICDNGVDATHADLNVVADNPGGNDHGTHVAGIAAGSGFQSNKTDTDGTANGGTPFQWRGMAPRAALVDSGDLTTAASLLGAIQNNSLDLANHSHVLGLDGDYNASTLLVDQEIRGGTVSAGTVLPRRPQVWGAANNGSGAQYGKVTEYFSLLNQSKNAIVVGAWNAFNNRLTGFSSMGPAHDGRLKPDVLAPGLVLKSTGTSANETQRIAFNGGTPTQGSFTLTFNGATTASIPFNASAATVRSRLEGLAGINAGDITASGGPLPATPVNITFVGPFVRTDQTQMTAIDTGLDPGINTMITTPTGGHDDRNGYITLSGTSMASPAVAGVVGLLLEAWQNTYSASLGTTINDAAPFPSTLRAILIQTAIDVLNAPDVRAQASPEVDSDSNPANGNDGLGTVAATAGPDFATGWGRVDAQAAAALIQEFRTLSTKPVPNRIIQDAVDQGATLQYDFVLSQPGPIRVTLAWDDVEAAAQNPATSPRLVNDLDLELVAPDGTTLFYPWQLGQTIVDLSGNPLANNAQPPGTPIQVNIPIAPNANPANPEYVPANALAAGGSWVATPGKDHLNNVEQVFVANAAQVGHWKARVIGFDVRQGPQDFSLVGFPYPQLPELVVTSSSKVGLTTLNTPINFSFKVENTGPVGTGTGFDYRVWLSRDFYVDGSDVLLTDTLQAPLAALGPSPASLTHNSSVQISQADADQLMGGTGTTIQQLQDADVFLLVEVDAPSVVLEHQEANVTFIQLARLVDVALVMDRSGSMSGVVPVSSGSQTKLQVLQDSANLFLDLIRLGAGDQLAEISFAGGVTTDFLTGTGLTPIDSSNLGAARTAVANLNADGSTNIRDGLQRGLDVLTAGTAANHRRVLIFFSDGMKTAGGDPTAASFLQQFGTKDVKAYSVGFGTRGGSGYTGIDVNLLSLLGAANPGGFFHVTESAVALDKFFVDAVAGAIRSEVVVDPEDDLPPYASHTVDLDLSGQDLSATFILTWDNPLLNLQLAVRTPSGLEINALNAGLFPDRVRIVQAPAYQLLTVRLPLRAAATEDHIGRWRMIIRNPDAQTVHYAASAIAESTLRASMPQPQPLQGGLFQPSEAITLQMTLRERGGWPVQGADVTVIPNVPLVSLGGLLAGAGITAGELAAVPVQIQNEPISQQERLYLALLKRVGGRNLLLRADGQPFKLRGDQNSGSYIGQLETNQVEGVYTFTARAQGRDMNCQRFQREVNLSVGVGLQPQSNGPPTIVAWDDPTGQEPSILVTVTPVGAGGTYLGPGLGSSVSIQVSAGLQEATPLLDNLDGTYSQTFRVVDPGLITVGATFNGLPLPSVVADTRLPAPVGLIPQGGRNDASTPITILLASHANVALIQGVTLVADHTIVPLEGFEIHSNEFTLHAIVPGGLPPGPYSVHLDSGQGHSLGSPGATFRVIGRGQNFPELVMALASRLNRLAEAPTPAAGLAELGLLLQDLRALPTGPNLTEEAKWLASNQVLDLLSRAQGRVAMEEMAAVLAAINAARIDARFASSGAVPTPLGSPVTVQLGSGVAARFGAVTQSGYTSLLLQQGPNELPLPNRGSPHLAYDITTTAQFAASSGVDIQIEYEPDDFADESRLRLFHLEDGTWVDRTTELDTDQNLLYARVSGLSPFVIVQLGGENPELRAIELDPIGGFTLQLQGDPGTYEIQSSADLVEWQRVGTVQLGIGAVSFTDTGANLESTRFYRAVKLQE